MDTLCTSPFSSLEWWVNKVRKLVTFPPCSQCNDIPQKPLFYNENLFKWTQNSSQYGDVSVQSILVLRKYSFPAHDRYWISFGRSDGSFLCWLIYQKEFCISVFKSSDLYEKLPEKSWRVINVKTLKNKPKKIHEEWHEVTLYGIRNIICCLSWVLADNYIASRNLPN